MKVFAILAGVLCTVSFIPQLLSIYGGKVKLSRAFLFIYFLGVINWGLFGITMTPPNIPLVFISGIQAAFVAILLIQLSSHESLATVTHLNPIIKKYAVARWRLFLGTLLGLILYPMMIYLMYVISSSLWELLSAKAVEPPTIAFMGGYDVPAQNGYWLFVGSSIVTALLLSALLPSVIGSSLGKYLLGIRYVDFHGNAVTIKQTLHKTAYGIGYFLILALPGPIIGFTMGMESTHLSVLALFIGFLVVLYLTIKKDQGGLVLSCREAQIVPILKKDLASFKSDMALVHAMQNGAAMGIT